MVAEFKHFSLFYVTVAMKWITNESNVKKDMLFYPIQQHVIFILERDNDFDSDNVQNRPSLTPT